MKAKKQTKQRFFCPFCNLLIVEENKAKTNCLGCGFDYYNKDKKKEGAFLKKYFLRCN
jgi:hypothetical protein